MTEAEIERYRLTRYTQFADPALKVARRVDMVLGYFTPYNWIPLPVLATLERSPRVLTSDL